VRQAFSQSAYPFGGAVQQRSRANLIRQLDGEVAVEIDRQQIRSRQAYGHGDNIGPFGELEQIAQQGIGGARRSLAKELAPWQLLPPLRGANCLMQRQHGSATPHPRFYEPFLLQLAIRAQNRTAIDVQLLGKATFGGQQLASR